MAPSSDVNDTDEDESKNSIVHKPFDKPSSENLIMDDSESECNIVNETSSQSDSSDVPINVITELNYDSLTSILRFSDEGLSKGLCTMEFFDSPSSVSLTSDDGDISFS